MNNIEKFKNLTGGLILGSDPLMWNYSVIKDSTVNKNIQKTKLPTTFRLWDSPIKNQLTKSTCVAHAMASAMEIMEYYDTGDRNQFSTSWYYGYRESDDYQGEGMYISECLDMARNIGGVYKSLMPDNLSYNESKNIIKDMTKTCLEQAKQHRIKNYGFLQSKYDIMETIYLNNTPVIIGLDTYESFLNIDADGIIPEPKINVEKNYGGHAVLCVGWTTILDEIHLVIKNSWGESWGDNGYGYMRLDGFCPFYEMYALFDEVNYPMEVTDIKGRWSEDYIKNIMKTGIVTGYPDGTFRPENPITREEVAVIVSRILDKMKYF